MSLWTDSPIQHIQDLAPQLQERASTLSKRGKDAFVSLFRQCADDVAQLAYTLMAPSFSWEDCHPGLGGKTLGELAGFTREILDLIQENKDAPGLEEWEDYSKRFLIMKYITEREEVDELLNLERTLGYFPLSAFVLAWLSSRSGRDSYIYRHGFAIWEYTENEGIAQMAEHLNITNERCRQIRSHLFVVLRSFLQELSLEGPCPYDYLSPELGAFVNNAENSAFTPDFIRYMFGQAYRDLCTVGLAEDSLLVKLKGGTADVFVAALPNSLVQKFDFNAFLSNIESVNGKKRTEIQRIPLPDGDEEVSAVAATLALLRYDWKRDNKVLLAPPNTDKNRPDIMEDIIRAAGHPLSIDEIVREYSARYPDRVADHAKIRSNMQVNPHIVPIGRSGVYSLSEWTSGSERGGTIRSFVRECLDGSETHIVPAMEVFEYVRRFRPSSSDENIVTNLMLETEKSFRIIWKDGMSYISYSAEEIPQGYKQITRHFCERRSFEESVALLERFIAKIGRMPKVGDDPDETRLARFLSNERSQRRHGMLTEKEMSELNRLEKKASENAIQLELF